MLDECGDGTALLVGYCTCLRPLGEAVHRYDDVLVACCHNRVGLHAVDVYTVSDADYWKGLQYVVLDEQ